MRACDEHVGRDRERKTVRHLEQRTIIADADEHGARRSREVTLNELELAGHLRMIPPAWRGGQRWLLADPLEQAIEILDGSLLEANETDALENHFPVIGAIEQQ